MSAFIVTLEHIHTIVAAGLDTRYGPLRWSAPDGLLPLVMAGAPHELGLEHSSWGDHGVLRHLDHASADVVGQILLSENVRSVDYRYSEVTELAPYWFRQPAARATPVEVLKAINCLDYQSCEVPDWAESEARRVLDAIRDDQINKLPGYAEAAWAIDERTHAAR